ncbi:unnamed protein product [Ilex paraguariensis]|uniref:F-box domain-containing protein n=1 Tax=Ilex paraguariensis TaxID=185542 RepID=A0ABC8V596_9AQUA
MLFFWITCFSIILLCKSFLKPLPTWTRKMNFFPPSWFLRLLSPFFTSRFKNRTKTAISFLQVLKYKIGPKPKAENVEEKEEISLLDLPDLALECILERLSPPGLCSMGAVCCSLRERCRIDHLWERHMKQKWSRVIGDAALREWQRHIASRKRETILDCKKENKGLLGKFSSVWSIFRNRSELDGSREQGSSLPVDSIMSQYLSLERGKFWFPAQVYNRENGLVGFMLSCYDAELRYDHRTDTFRARYSSHGRQIIEDNVEWNRLRPPAVNTPPTVLHVSDCLNDLKPGDHIEIQWRRNKEFAYGVSFGAYYL